MIIYIIRLNNSDNFNEFLLFIIKFYIITNNIYRFKDDFFNLYLIVGKIMFSSHSFLSVLHPTLVKKLRHI